MVSEIVLAGTFLALATFTATLRPCKEVKFVGKTFGDLKKPIQAHDSNLSIFWGHDYTIQDEGCLLGWTYYQMDDEKRGFYMVIWRESSGYFYLKQTYKISGNSKGNKTFIFNNCFLVSVELFFRFLKNFCQS